MSLITQNELKKVVGLSQYGKFGDLTSYLLMYFSRLHKINKIYNKLQHLSGQNFINALLQEFKLKYEINKDDLKRIPKTGPFITISNHPLGVFDGALLLKIISTIRPDYKIIANFILERIKPIKSYIFPVNPFENYTKSSISGIKNAFKYVKEGYSIGIFPAGEVSSIQKKNKKIIYDRTWQKTAIKFILKTKVPIIPIYLHGKNSNFFYFFGKINEYFRTAMLPYEMFTQKGKLIKIRIGNPIYTKNLKNVNIQEYTKFLRRKTYILSNVYNKKKYINYNIIYWINNIKKITPPVPIDLIENDLCKLNNTNLLFSNSQYDIFFTSASCIPNILTEIGRLREISFREAGQGTNKSIDLDKYDKYYYHLFLWDKYNKCIVGAYRMGLGKEIFNKYGIKGFYLTKFFLFDKKMISFYRNSIEMSRAFLIKEYQQKTLPLFLLWKGILHLITKYPEYKYLIGAVSISRQLSDFSISVIIEFMKLYFYDNYLAKYVHPKNEYIAKVKYSDQKFIINESKADLDKFDKLIDEIEPGKLRLPVLMKKYIKQKARLISFNVDPKFNYSTDCLMYIKISDLEKK